jgi:hypothetical protein
VEDRSTQVATQLPHHLQQTIGQQPLFLQPVTQKGWLQPLEQQGHGVHGPLVKASSWQVLI